MCVAGEVGWCLQTLLSSAHVDDHDGHLTSVHGLRKLRVSVQMLLSFPLHLCQLTTGGPESIDGLLGFPLHYVAHKRSTDTRYNTDSQSLIRFTRLPHWTGACKLS